MEMPQIREMGTQSHNTVVEQREVLSMYVCALEYWIMMMMSGWVGKVPYFTRLFMNIYL